MGWQDEVLSSLKERDRGEKALAKLIEHNQRWIQQALACKDRHASLLRSANLGPTVVSHAVPIVGQRTTSMSSNASSGGQSHEEGAISKAYTASLENQIATLREELSSLYKIQSQNAQRLLTLTENLREKEDTGKEAEERVRTLKADGDRLKRKAEEARGVTKEREKNIQFLQDELATLQLEYSQLEKRNDALSRDNAALLKRWLDKMNDEANAANARFLEEVNRKESHDTQAISPKPQTAQPQPQEAAV
ncbi:uncharacterized protein L969DRAFT_51222 [Mixia osmundae IAM 14324]|uniref:Autophagy-related protein 16 domain-containing protein n=1 Tax=Mixia osmundae (strain CBS 9802 / IAM 14324 / JCM 22182 / KY 12970) TaxID=764103 RepID=G7E7M9_MIXOS|nr:uncharacterized protein L969DRAFT_51222 [Mixia osmundae IAM 14324]KEI38439.1 hypothetical protein L969DRAFT_51222 [Mixia osmundae IAM 14324]GAA98839.1 hypothetical protein E5Q_05527 [Mixia osmundae IAM 14324]